MRTIAFFAKVLADFVDGPGATPMRTADGTVTVRVRTQGLNVISIVHEASNEPAEADIV